MSTKSGTNDAMQTKMINATSRLVPMHLQIKALKSLMKAKKKIVKALSMITIFNLHFQLNTEPTTTLCSQ